MAYSFIGPPHSDLATPLHHAGGKCFLRKNLKLCKTRVHISFLLSPFNLSVEILQLQIHKTILNLLLNPTVFKLCSQTIYLPVSHLSSMLHSHFQHPSIFHLLHALWPSIVAIYKFVSNPVLCPISYVLLQHLFLSGLHKTVSTSKIIAVPFKYFSKSLFPSLSNFHSPTSFPTPIFTHLSHLSSCSLPTPPQWKSLLITLHSNHPLKHWPSLKVLCLLLPEENSMYKQACFKTSILLPKPSCV